MKVVFLINNINHYILILVSGARSRAKDLGIDLVVLAMTPSTSSSPDVTASENYQVDLGLLRNVLSFVKEIKADALVVNTEITEFIENTSIISNFAKTNGIALVGISAQLEHASLIQTENFKGTYNATRHLIEKHGCKNIVYISGPRDNDESRQRLNGFKEAVEAGGIFFNQKMVYYGDFFYECGERFAQYVLDNMDKFPDGIVAANDNMLYGAIEAFKRHNKYTPKHYACIGFDATIASQVEGFSTVDQKMFNLAREAIDECRRLVKAGTDAQNAIIKVPNKLLIRKNCGCKQEKASYLTIWPDIEEFEKSCEAMWEQIESYYFSDNNERSTFYVAVKDIFFRLHQQMTVHEMRHLKSLEEDFKLSISELKTQNVDITNWLDILSTWRNDAQNLKVFEDQLLPFISRCESHVHMNISSAKSNNDWVNEHSNHRTLHFGNHIYHSESMEQLIDTTIKYWSSISGRRFSLGLLENNAVVPKTIHDLNSQEEEIETHDISNGKLAEYIEKKYTRDMIIAVLGSKNKINGFYIASLSTATADWTDYMSLQFFLSFSIDNLNNLTALKVAEQKALDAALYDQLTGLKNRRYFDRYIKEGIEKQRLNIIKQDYSIAIIIIDIDFFKKINDRFGHDVGDLVLTRASAIWTETLQQLKLKHDFIRWGGEEFLITLDTKSDNNIKYICESLRIATENMDIKTQEQCPIKVTCSLGYSIMHLQSPEFSMEKLIKYADLALYQSKGNGRNAWHGFNDIETLVQAGIVSNSDEVFVNHLVTCDEYDFKTQQLLH